VLTLGQPIGAIAAANPMISQHPWVPAAKTTASVYNDDLQGTGGVRLAGLINTLKAVWAGPDPRLVIDLAETGLTENDRKSLEFNVCFRSEDYHSCLTHR
jgi:hypothetical protein